MRIDKLKVGDRVKLIDNGGMSAKVGETAVIIDLKQLLSDGCINIKWDNRIMQHNGCYEYENFELISSDETNKQRTNNMKFKIKKDKQDTESVVELWLEKGGYEGRVFLMGYDGEVEKTIATFKNGKIKKIGDAQLSGLKTDKEGRILEEG